MKPLKYMQNSGEREVLIMTWSSNWDACCAFASTMDPQKTVTITTLSLCRQNRI